MGNVAPDGLQSVWQNDTYRQYRRNYLAGNVAGTLCAGCKVQNEVDFSYKPGKSFWRRVAGRKELSS
jgi:hypothetical protein